MRSSHPAGGVPAPVAEVPDSVSWLRQASAGLFDTGKRPSGFGAVPCQPSRADSRSREDGLPFRTLLKSGRPELHRLGGSSPPRMAWSHSTAGYTVPAAPAFKMAAALLVAQRGRIAFPASPCTRRPQGLVLAGHDSPSFQIARPVSALRQSTIDGLNISAQAPLRAEGPGKFSPFLRAVGNAGH